MPIAAIFATVGAETAALTAAEIAAAEAAKIAAAEAAAAAAAEAAAATAAQQAAVTTAQQAATQQAAQQAATSTAANVGSAEALNLAAQQQAAQQAGIMGIEGAAANAPLTAEATQAAAMNSGIQAPMARGISAPYPPLEVGANPSAPFAEYFGQQAGQQAGIANPALASQPPMGIEGQIPADQFIEPGSGGIYSLQNTMAQANVAPPPPSALEVGMDKATKFAQKNPFTAMTGAYLGANALGLMNPSGNTFNDDRYSGPLSKYRLSPDFRSSNANPEDFQYTPRRYASGGVMDAAPVQAMSDRNDSLGYQQGIAATGGQAVSFAKGGSLSDSIEKYQKMLEGETKEAPAKSANVGIYYDQDPDTRYQDALTAAQIRQAKVNQRAYVSPPVARRPTPMGQLQMASVKAAQGGIMQSSLGGYAAGGNPRLLKGPGDGMSDNIPATINGRQPARLADGEFVIPADVVSHLGNGSTEAGAKQLHAMMNRVRKARTGNPKQGKNIKPQKYLPK
jgi:hypothetical protein